MNTPLAHVDIPAATATWSTLLTRFVLAQRCSATARAYGRDVERFVRFAQGHGIEPTGMLPEVVEAYGASLRHSGLAPKTIARATTALRTFLRFRPVRETTRLARDVVDDVLPAQRGDARQPHALPRVEDVVALGTAAGDVRERAILYLLAGTGVRVAEASGLDVLDLQDGDTAMIATVRGKGGKTRRVAVPPRARAALLGYLAATDRTLGSAGPVFLNLLGTRMSPTLLRRTMARLTKRAQLDGRRVTPHTLRVFCGTRNARGGVPLHDVQALLGHSSLATTQGYLRAVAAEDLAARLVDVPEAACPGA